MMIEQLHVPEFVEPEKWLPNSPDLNSVDYSIWRVLQQLVYHCRRIRDVEHLKEVLETCWEEIVQDIINSAIGQFRRLLSFVVATGGGHIEHRFFLVLHIHYHTYVFYCRNTGLVQQK